MPWLIVPGEELDIWVVWVPQKLAQPQRPVEMNLLERVSDLSQYQCLHSIVVAMQK